jgi:hypothetical protein
VIGSFHDRIEHREKKSGRQMCSASRASNLEATGLATPGSPMESTVVVTDRATPF